MYVMLYNFLNLQSGVPILVFALTHFSDLIHVTGD